MKPWLGSSASMRGARLAWLQRRRRITIRLFAVAAFSVVLAAPAPAQGGPITPAAPITHVVIIDQENHSFDNVLGAWCVQTARCNGATTAQVFNGTTTTTLALPPATDIVP